MHCCQNLQTKQTSTSSGYGYRQTELPCFLDDDRTFYCLHIASTNSAPKKRKEGGHLNITRSHILIGLLLALAVYVDVHMW